ncbi:LysR family transcriptional regulator [Mesobaculum littorinae]|nr:LysR family transcriptional regulator [Mesobaculum littorinae]
MVDNELSIGALRVFRQVVRSGGFAAASRVLDLPKSTVSKRIRDLELSLGVRLIERTTRQMRITPEGAMLAERADRLLADADALRRAVGQSGAAADGHLRIASPAFFGQIFLGPVAARCHRLHPDLTLEFTFLDRLPDLVEEGFDGAITVGPLPDSDLMMRRLHTARAVPVAAPDLPGINRVREPEDMRRITTVTFGPRRNRLHLVRDGDCRSVDVTGALTFGAIPACASAILAGGGAGMLPAFLAAPLIAEGRLVRLLPDWTGAEVPFHFVYPSPQSATGRLRAFLDLLVAEMRNLDHEEP